MQTTAMAYLKYTLENAVRTIDTVTGRKAIIHMRADYFIKLRPSAFRPSDSGIKAASRATKVPHKTS